jgi:thiosulfate dehydrogenase (quinone) large subunit
VSTEIWEIYNTGPWSTRPTCYETGRKDTVICYPNEVTGVISTFDRAGHYIWQCHLLTPRGHDDTTFAGDLMSATLPHARTDAVRSSPVISSDVRRYWLVRLGFGLIWGIDATLKWLPGFRDQYLAMIKNAGQGQPPWLMPWFHFWASLTGTAPGLFAVLTAVTETVICLSLLLGVLQRAGFGLGIVFGLLIWGVGEGFGGPYMSGATDIGCAIIYSVVFVALLAVPQQIRASAPSADTRLVARWPGLAPLTFQSTRRATHARCGS